MRAYSSARGRARPSQTVWNGGGWRRCQAENGSPADARHLQRADDAARIGEVEPCGADGVEAAQLCDQAGEIAGRHPGLPLGA